MALDLQNGEPRPSQALFQILRLACFGLAFQFCLDAVVFRTPWYGRCVEPDSLAGSYETTLRNEGTRVLTGSRHVLLFGDSTMAEGFSATFANDSVGGKDWFFSSAGTPGATPRAWFYLLRDLDPRATRYNVIVLPLTDYADADSVEPFGIDKEADSDLDLNRLIVRLRLADTLTFPFTYLDPKRKLSALEGTLFKGYVYRRDLKEFLSDPEARLDKVKLFAAHSREWIDAYPGHTGTLEGLAYDPARNAFTFPAGISQATRDVIQARYHPERLRVEGYRRAYREKWLGAIIDHYKGSGAIIVLFRRPFGPIPLHAAISNHGETFVEQVESNPNVVVLDRDMFGDLETPGRFFDAYHLNSEGRVEFTARLARAIVEAAGALPRRNP